MIYVINDSEGRPAYYKTSLIQYVGLHLMHNLNFLIEKELFIRFKTKCIEESKSMTEVLVQFIKEYIQDEKIQGS